MKQIICKSYPAVSENIVKKLTNTLLRKNNSKMFLEWGSGESTLFYLDFMLKNNIEGVFVSLECNFSWHKTVVETIRSKYKNAITQEQTTYEKWNDTKCRSYLNAPKQHICFDVPEAEKMLSVGKEKVEKMLLAKEDDKEGLADGNYTALINRAVSFNYILKSECFKDQYGESPIKDEYIYAGISKIEYFLAKNHNGLVIIAIDGGPRMDILQALFKIEKEYPKAKLFICLHDASRLFYQEILNRYPKGRFINGSGRLINGKLTFGISKYNRFEAKFWHDSNSIPSLGTLIEKEAWIYEKV